MAVSRRTVAQFILLGWAAALAWLARRQFYQTDASNVAAATTRLEPSAQYFAVRVGSRQIGQLNITVDTMVDGVRLSEQFVLDVPLGQMARGTEVNLTRSLRLVNASVRTFGVLGSAQVLAAIGTDSILNARGLEREPVIGRITARVDPHAVLPLMLPYRAAFGGQLRVGAAFDVPLLDLANGTTTRMPVRVTAESTFIVPDSAVFDSAANRWVAAATDTVRAWRLEHAVGGQPTRTWVDAAGSVVRSETARGLTLERSAWEMVRNNYQMQRIEEGRSAHRAVPGVRALARSGLVPDTAARERTFLVLGDTGAGPGLAAGLAGGRQEVRGDTVRVSRRTAPDSAAPRPVGELGGTVDLPASHSGVRREAILAVRGSRTLEDSLRGLVRRVAREIGPDTAVSAPAAVQAVLETRSAGPDGRARLLVAMARSLGIPARVATGVAALPEGVYAHAWTELWAGRWVAADPTFGHYPASPSLVRFATGRRSHPIDLIPLVASARFLPLSPSP